MSSKVMVRVVPVEHFIAQISIFSASDGEYKGVN